jgi:hypothetical protein
MTSTSKKSGLESNTSFLILNNRRFNFTVDFPTTPLFSLFLCGEFSSKFVNTFLEIQLILRRSNFKDLVLFLVFFLLTSVLVIAKDKIDNFNVNSY